MEKKFENKEKETLNKNSYSACEIAEYIIYYSYIKEYPISNLKLQKLLYFVQEEFMKNKKECFKDEIEFWDCGPVVVNVYKKYKVYAGGNIPGFIAKDSNNISENDKTVIASVVERYKDKTSSQLLEICKNL